eukprot:COSAG06_NODE_17474_length_939_cov_0.840476_1_plen_102_part_00
MIPSSSPLERSSGHDRAAAAELRSDDEPGGLVQLVLDGLGLMPSVLKAGQLRGAVLEALAPPVAWHDEVRDLGLQRKNGPHVGVSSCCLRRRRRLSLGMPS